MFTIDVPPPPGIPPVYGDMPTGARLAAVIGAPNSICITPGLNQVLLMGESTYPGIREYWFADLQNGRVLCYTAPEQDSYRVIRELHSGDRIAPQLLPELVLPVEALL